MAGTLRRRMAFASLARSLWAATRPGGPGIGRRLAAVPRLVGQTLRGRYDGGFRVLLMALASVYVISPIDAIPELFTAFVGLIDDAVVVAWLAGAVISETDRFLAWESARVRARRVVDGQVR